MAEIGENTAKDGQHQHSARSMMDLILDEDMRPTVAKHVRESPKCFPHGQDWPMHVEQEEPGDNYPKKGNVICGRCMGVIGTCTILGVKKRGKK